MLQECGRLYWLIPLYSSVGLNPFVREHTHTNILYADKLLKLLLLTLILVCVLADKPCHLPETWLFTLFTMIELHRLQKEKAICNHIFISLLQASKLTPELNNSMCIPQSTNTKPNKWSSLTFNDGKGHADMSISFRHCDSLSEALEGAPIRLIYADSLIMWKELGNFETVSDKMNQLCASLKVSLVPCSEWEKRIEDKKYVNSQLSDFMLPTCWLELSVQQTSEIKAMYADEHAMVVDLTQQATSSNAASASSTTTSFAMQTPEEILEDYNNKASEKTKIYMADLVNVILRNHENGMYVVKGQCKLPAT